MSNDIENQGRVKNFFLIVTFMFCLNPKQQVQCRQPWPQLRAYLPTIGKVQLQQEVSVILSANITPYSNDPFTRGREVQSSKRL